MKKIIKTFTLMLFIIFVFGITTSLALTVNNKTTANQMIQALNNGGVLTGISPSIRRENPYLYCRQHHKAIYADAKYTYANGNEEKSKVVYDTESEYSGDNEYAKAYILAAEGYDKNSDRQNAWWKILGQGGENNNLYKIAMAYQNFKLNKDIPMQVINSDAKTTMVGADMVYGPIQIQYSYEGSDNPAYEFGGFSYALLDKNDSDLSEKIKICILKDEQYVPIEATKNSNNYYKVKTTDYNKVNLYIVTQDKTISEVNLKIQENRTEYRAEVYEIVGTYTPTYTHTSYCMTCQEKMDNAVTSLGTAVSNGKGTYVKYGGNYYKYDGYDLEHYYKAYSSVSNVYRVGGTDYSAPGDSSYPFSIKGYYCTACGASSSWLHGSVYTKDSAANKLYSSHYSFPHYCSVHSSQFQCTACHNSRCRNYTTSAHKAGYCTFNSRDTLITHFKNYHVSTTYKWWRKAYEFSSFNGCGCATTYYKNSKYPSQALFIIKTATENKKNEIKLDIKVPFTTEIQVTKEWNDYDHAYGLRPETLKFNVFRSIDNENWKKLTENTDYEVKIESKEGNTWIVTITNLLRVDDDGNEYSFKVEEQELDCYQPTYPDGKYPEYNEETAIWYIDIENSLKKIDLNGYVWLDGQTGIKPAVPNNGIMDSSEAKMKDIVVHLYYKDPITQEIKLVETTVTDANGYYEFKGYEIGYYFIKFEYDGVHYEDTISVENGSSKAFETDGDRTTFNGRFQTITYGKSNDGTTLSYNYSNNKSTLITTKDNGQVKQEFAMNAQISQTLYIANTENLNLGLVKRGTDIALSTDVSTAEVKINGQKTTYTYNSAENTIEIGNGQTSEQISYNLNLYASDYNYRIRNYVSNDTFKENDYINEENPEGVTTGEELKVFVTYELNLQNQSTETTKINEVKYTFDEKYTFKQIVDNSYAITVSGKVITINTNGLTLKEGETKTIYLLFEVNNNNNGLTLGNFSNKAEITSYSTDKGFIDVDSQPGNFVNSNQVEDDNDTAGGLTIKTEDTFARKITGKVFDEENQNVNDVIVQLIELKTVNGKMYEYIWQETVSGTGKGLRLNGTGTALEEYTYTKTDGIYEFIGFIPGDYIVRFIYGDGTTYDMTGSLIKYNGQDYKSAEDANYKVEWYNSATYTQGASVARDNEARRLETMAYSIEIDAQKGVLLKLLNNVTVENLNETEKEVLISIYNSLYDPDITSVTTEAINKLLKEQVLKNTWMCAETSKIKVAVDTENITNTNTETTVKGTNGAYVEEIPNINLGLELRPVTKIELKKYITGFKLVAANGQTLVNAYIDVNEYLNDPSNISNKVQGIRDNVTILDTVWQYEVVPTEINTIVDGASLEFEYTLVVKNTGDTDYLSAELADAYNNRSTTDYKTLLTSKSKEIKDYMRAGTYRTQIGKNVGESYYIGGAGASKVLTEITNIRDYINNDLKFVSSDGNVAVDEDAPHTYRILRDDYSMQEATINTVLKTTETTGKMENDGTAILYTITLGKNPISSTGNLNFENYIAEVMSYTNAAGRRAMTSTPGNAEIIDHEHRAGKSHEIDEADTARIQIGAATGEDEIANYIIIIAITAGILVMAAGTVVVKKYVIK